MASACECPLSDASMGLVMKAERRERREERGEGRGEERRGEERGEERGKTGERGER